MFLLFLVVTEETVPEGSVTGELLRPEVLEVEMDAGVPDGEDGRDFWGLFSGVFGSSFVVFFGDLAG